MDHRGSRCRVFGAGNSPGQARASDEPKYLQTAASLIHESVWANKKAGPGAANTEASYEGSKTCAA